MGVSNERGFDKSIFSEIEFELCACVSFYIGLIIIHLSFIVGL